ncbi:MAG: hypothetical protein RL037_1378 [Bacteroidota bacterium]|jgi:endonuclease/exonuclease/phosphatase family metal-dependent hydrolase
MSDWKNRIWRFSSVFKILSIFSFLSLLLCYVSPYFHPKTLSFLPFAGLTYPLIITVNFAWLFFWIILRSKWALYTLFIILLGGNLHFRSFPITFYEDKPGENKLKVTSYNVRLFDIYNPNFEGALRKRNQIFSFLRSNNADVICIQEFYRQEKPTRFETIDSLFAIVGNSKFYHERSAFNKHANQNFGVALFSKYRIIAKGDIKFHTQSDNDVNYCIYADIVKEKDTFRIYNVHLQSIRLSNAYEGDKVLMKNIEEKRTIMGVYKKLQEAFLDRADQARTVIEHVNSSPYSTVICGDFNDTPMSYTYNIFNRKLKDAFRNTSTGIGSTYIGKIPAGRIDYIFHTPDLKSNNFEIQVKELSDHRAISCIISK